jgi:nuclear cap-binding protein subunit 1
VWADQKSNHQQEDYLDSLWAQLEKLREDQWIERHILRPYVSFKALLQAAEQHNLTGYSFRKK